MKTTRILFVAVVTLLGSLLTMPAYAEPSESQETAQVQSPSTSTELQAPPPAEEHRAPAPAPQRELTPFEKFARRFSVGGYGEAVMTRNFYSQHFNRYKYPANYADDGSHGQFDLPHVVVNLAYEFGKGWRVSTEIEFEHGGTESAVEVDADESGEYEAEVEKGGEVAIEQFWIEKTFSPLFNLRAGEIVVPVGATNAHHTPTEFFTCYRPEGENTLLPCTWHQVGVSLWGQGESWKYEAQFLSGLDAEKFGADCFVHYGATSIYEYKIANTYAGMLRLDNYTVPGLRMALSGYYGRTFANKLRVSSAAKYADVKGDLVIGAFDFEYNANNIVARGNFDYAHLSDADLISAYNITYPKHTGQDGSPSKHTPVASKALCYAVEAGYNFLGLSDEQTRENRKLILFGRYEFYDTMKESYAKTSYAYCEKSRFAIGLNYFPMPEIVVKAEFSKRLYNDPYNDEPSISMGIAYSAWYR